jgi:hypothetical protein
MEDTLVQQLVLLTQVAVVAEFMLLIQLPQAGPVLL